MMLCALLLRVLYVCVLKSCAVRLRHYFQIHQQTRALSKYCLMTETQALNRCILMENQAIVPHRAEKHKQKGR
jgi:hypothetical protein